MTHSPMAALERAIRQHGLVRFLDHLEQMYPTCHLKDLVVDEVGLHRQMVVGGRRVTNFGSDSFLGLDEDPRLRQAVSRGVERWGTHNGASRAFASIRANELAEEKLAGWLGTEATLIYPSVTLANLGAIPGLVGRRDLLVVDEQAHNSVREGARIARANGTRVEYFSHCNPIALEQILTTAQPYRVAVVAMDGVYSMSGALPPLAELNAVALQHNAVLYVDDAHGTGVLGRQGRGTVLDALGSYDNTLVVGSLSKAFSCAGAFLGCSNRFKKLLKIRSSTYIFGGPVPPPYLEAICTACDILASPEYDRLIGQLRRNLQRLTEGVRSLGLVLLGSQTPIVSILVGDEETTLRAGHFLFERGFYVQSVVFPAVPYHAGVLRIQVNANHLPESIEGLLEALAELKRRLPLPESVPPQDDPRLAA